MSSPPGDRPGGGFCKQTPQSPPPPPQLPQPLPLPLPNLSSCKSEGQQPVTIKPPIIPNDLPSYRDLPPCCTPPPPRPVTSPPCVPTPKPINVGCEKYNFLKLLRPCDVKIAQECCCPYGDLTSICSWFASPKYFHLCSTKKCCKTQCLFSNERKLCVCKNSTRNDLRTKISTNTLHGVRSVGDLRAWSVCCDDQRRYFLETMLQSGDAPEVADEEYEIVDDTNEANHLQIQYESLLSQKDDEIERLKKLLRELENRPVPKPTPEPERAPPPPARKPSEPKPVVEKVESKVEPPPRKPSEPPPPPKKEVDPPPAPPSRKPSDPPPPPKKEPDPPPAPPTRKPSDPPPPPAKEPDPPPRKPSEPTPPPAKEPDPPPTRKPSEPHPPSAPKKEPEPIPPPPPKEEPKPPPTPPPEKQPEPIPPPPPKKEPEPAPPPPVKDPEPLPPPPKKPSEPIVVRPKPEEPPPRKDPPPEETKYDFNTPPRQPSVAALPIQLPPLKFEDESCGCPEEVPEEPPCQYEPELAECDNCQRPADECSCMQDYDSDSITQFENPYDTRVIVEGDLIKKIQGEQVLEEMYPERLVAEYEWLKEAMMANGQRVNELEEALFGGGDCDMDDRYTPSQLQNQTRLLRQRLTSVQSQLDNKNLMEQQLRDALEASNYQLAQYQEEVERNRGILMNAQNVIMNLKQQLGDQDDWQFEQNGEGKEGTCQY